MLFKYSINQSVFKKIIENIIWLSGDRLIKLFIGLVVGVLSARYLGPGNFGLLNYSMAVIGLMSSIVALGLQSVVVRDLIRKPDIQNEIIGSAFVLQGMAGLVIYFLLMGCIFLVDLFEQSAKVILSVLGLLVIFRVSDVANYWFESELKMRHVVVSQNIALIFFSLLKVLCLFFKFPLIWFVTIISVEGLISAVITLIIFNKIGLNLKKLTFSFDVATNIMRDSWPLLFSSMAIMIYMRIDQVMLGHMMGDSAVGIYTAALRISEVWYFVPLAIASSAAPIILDSKKSSEVKSNRQYQALYDFMVLLAIFVALPMTFLSGYVIEFLYGPNYSDSSVILGIHIWASVFVFLGVVSSNHFVSEGLQRHNLGRAILGMVVNICLNLVLIPIYGAIGAAIATVVAQMCSSLLFDGLSDKTRSIFKMKTAALYLPGSIKRLSNIVLNGFKF